MKDYLRRGLSAIVASVLMVLIVVVAVGVVWGVLIPLLDVDIASSQNAVSIDTSGGYTLYDAEQKLACVNIKKDLDVEIEGFKILFFFEGDSHEATISEQDDLPDFNQKKTYCFNLSNYEISPSRVSVVTLPEDNFVSSSIDLKEGTFTADFIEEITKDDESSGGREGLDFWRGIVMKVLFTTKVLVLSH